MDLWLVVGLSVTKDSACVVIAFVCSECCRVVT